MNGLKYLNFVAKPIRQAETHLRKANMTEKRLLVAAIAVLVATFVLPSASFAACSGASYSSSYCLEGRRDNPGAIGSGSYWRAKNICPGTMKVEVGFCNRNFFTGQCSGSGHGTTDFNLTQGQQRSGEPDSGVGYVKCCRTGTDNLAVPDDGNVSLCDLTQDQLVSYNTATSCDGSACTATDCENSWDDSSASDHCTNVAHVYLPDDEGLPVCSITGSCHDRSVIQNVMLEDVDDLHACRTGRVLRTDACPDYDCNDHYCTVADCRWHWNQSPASDTCTALTTDFRYSGTEPQCALTVQCGVNTYSVTEAMWDIDDLEACGPNGGLWVGSCD